MISENLKRNIEKLVRFSKLKRREVKTALKNCSRSFVEALSEIALNVREGVVKVANRIKNSKLVKALSQRTTPIKLKYQLLRAAVAPIIVQGIVTTALAILNGTNAVDG